MVGFCSINAIIRRCMLFVVGVGGLLSFVSVTETFLKSVVYCVE